MPSRSVLEMMLVIATSMGAVIRSRAGPSAAAFSPLVGIRSRRRRGMVVGKVESKSPPHVGCVTKWSPDKGLHRRRLSVLSLASRFGDAPFSSVAVNGDAVVERMNVEAENEMMQLEMLYGRGTSPTSLKEMRRPQLITTREQAQAFMKEVDTVLFDCDGVLYRWPDPIPGARECLRSLLLPTDGDRTLLPPQKKDVYFVTNNAGTSRRQLCDKLNGVLGFATDDVDDVRLTEDMMISSSYSAARYLQQELDENRIGGRRIYVIGSLGLCQELEEAGFVIVGGGPSPPAVPTSMSREELAAYDFDDLHGRVDAVVVGHDTEFNFRKLCVANVLLQRNPEAPLVATNLDSFDVVGSDARHIPGNGCVVRALEHSSKRTAVNVGKPSTTLASLLARESGGRCIPSRTVIVGDRLDTDIKFGRDTGMHSLLVMTGVTTAAYLSSFGAGTDEEPLPTHIMAHIGLFA